MKIKKNIEIKLELATRFMIQLWHQPSFISSTLRPSKVKQSKSKTVWGSTSKNIFSLSHYSIKKGICNCNGFIIELLKHLEMTTKIFRKCSFHCTLFFPGHSFLSKTLTIYGTTWEGRGPCFISSITSTRSQTCDTYFQLCT